MTSRWSAWGSQATPMRVNVLAREESIAFLGKRIGSDDQAMLDALAELLGEPTRASLWLRPSPQGSSDTARK